MRKLIFFDIDGTIITEGAEPRIIPDSFSQALHALQERGHICFINTGRAFCEIEDTIRQLQFDGYICGCGTYIQYKGETLYSHTIPFSLGNAILHALERDRLEWALEGTDCVYYSHLPYHTLLRAFKEDHKKNFPDAFCAVTPEQMHDLTFDKFCICQKEGHRFDDFRRQFQDSLTFIDRKGGFYEIMPKGNSKASGMQFLEEYLQIPHKDTIAIGDSTNDLPMLEYAGYSIAMGNGAPELFPIVDYITDSVTEDGILHAMQHLGLI